MAVINWDELWKTKLLSTYRIKLCQTSYWDKCAVSFNQKTIQMQDLTKSQLDRINLRPEYTVIDIGAGTGRLTIPLAKQVKQVTAVEPSTSMLSLLKSNAEKANIQNIVPLNISCEQITVNENLFPHDVVVASFSLFMSNLSKTLQKLDSLATKNVYLFSSASRWISEELQKIISGEPLPFTCGDYIYIYNILHELGILANVEVWNFESKQYFTDLNAAVARFMETYRIATNHEEDLKSYLRKILTIENGNLLLKQQKKAAVIWWTKTE
ncbi:MAG: class I SAM-dependent methyltransferase [Candidatus Bathyarchaeota archaeon]|nr:class I SAM-dependent methyltransferase [Candidatus Bathyarchaeum tardum]WNZ29972.1 MAG: class I SAM-dependent methyltransferase [Candidatus Bathyarchaeota archaeon]